MFFEWPRVNVCQLKAINKLNAMISLVITKSSPFTPLKDLYLDQIS